MTTYPDSTLVQNNGNIYHLAVSSKDIADNIIVVGDPERVPKVADLIFDKNQPIFRKDHRGLCTMTGYTTDGLRVSVITHGMGTGSTEIVINEIIALKTINLETKTRNNEIPHPMNIVRLGTSGALQTTTELGTAIITKYAIGMDNTGMFYDVPYANEKTKQLEDLVIKRIDEAIPEKARFKGRIFPYVSLPNPDIVDALKQACEKTGLKHKIGITVSGAGFFVCQGRNLFEEHPHTIKCIDEVLEKVEFDGVKPENFEMEISTISQICQPFNWIRAGCMCMAIANRRQNTFAKNTDMTLNECILTTLEAFRILNKK